MSLRNKINKDFEEGKKSEKFFIDVATTYGYECFTGSNYHDIFERWEVLIKKNDKKARVQVKGLKDAHIFGYTWIELKKDNGDNGWLYGEADVLAIKLPDRFNIYRMNLLRKLIEEKIDYTKPILKNIPKNENGDTDYEYMRFRLYNGYNRRNDITVIVSLADIEHCKIFTMNY